jgi:hypothetical protein
MRIAALACLIALPASAQLNVPPDGDNMRSTVTQQMGPVTISIDYSSPRVVRGKEDRRGQIWGKLVPFGLSDLGFNGCTKCPWRAGANENTVVEVSQPVKVQGQPLPAGRYGLHMIPGIDEWTVIFSKNSSSWGSFSYDPKEDQLRVKSRPQKAPYREWLTYEFTDREPTRAVVMLEWEELSVPLTIAVDNAPQLWVESFRRELRGMKGFTSFNWKTAADYCLTNKVNLTEALAWAQKAVSGQFIGQENFQNLMTLSRALAANGKPGESDKMRERAIAHATANALEVHMVGRQLLTDGKKQEALQVFEANAKRFPNQWPVHVGLMRGYAANGKLKEALEEAKLALPQAPDDLNRNSLQKCIQTLSAGKNLDQ